MTTSCNLWDSNETQFCAGCQLYHYRDECTDVYFNDPSNWDNNKKEGNQKCHQ